MVEADLQATTQLEGKQRELFKEGVLLVWSWLRDTLFVSEDFALPTGILAFDAMSTKQKAIALAIVSSRLINNRPSDRYADKKWYQATIAAVYQQVCLEATVESSVGHRNHLADLIVAAAGNGASRHSWHKAIKSMIENSGYDGSLSSPFGPVSSEKNLTRAIRYLKELE